MFALGPKPDHLVGGRHVRFLTGADMVRESVRWSGCPKASASWMMRGRSYGKPRWRVSLKPCCMLTNTIYRFKRIGLEAGPLSQWLPRPADRHRDFFLTAPAKDLRRSLDRQSSGASSPASRN